MKQANNFEDRLNGSGINIAITPEVATDQRISIIKMLMCQVARAAGGLTGGDIHAMTRKYIQLLMAVKELGLLDTTRLAGCFELTTDEVALLVDRLVIEPNTDDHPDEPHVLEAKMALNMVAHAAYSATLIMALPMVSPELSRLVADITDPEPVYHPVLPNATEPVHNAIPHVSAVDNSGSGGGEDHSTRDLIVGAVVIAAAAIAVYHGVKYLAGNSLDGPVLSDLDTTL